MKEHFRRREDQFKDPTPWFRARRLVAGRPMGGSDPRVSPWSPRGSKVVSRMFLGCFKVVSSFLLCPFTPSPPGLAARRQVRATAQPGSGLPLAALQ